MMPYIIQLICYFVILMLINKNLQFLYYSKCSKILNTFLFLFSYKRLVSRAGIHTVLVRIANREDPDKTASPTDLGLFCLSRPFWQATSVQIFRTFTIYKSNIN